MDRASQILEQLSENATLKEAELAQLPKWALVALANRCARRAQPLFTKDWPDAPAELRETIDRALRLTESSAANARTDPGLQDAALAAGKTATTAANVTARFASFTVCFAAVNAANVANAENAENAVAFVQATADACHKSATFASARFSIFKTSGAGQDGGVSLAFTRAMRRDFNELLNRAQREGWGEDTPVDIGALGPLWQEGAPAGFPAV